MKSLLLPIVFVAIIASSSHAAEYRLPFSGRWFVMAGGDTANVNHHMKEVSQWYGVDFMRAGGTSRRAIAKNGGKTLDDYYSWGEPVLSPVDGVVRSTHDGEPDNPIGTRDQNHAFGNYVVIEAGPREFVYLGHLQNGSLAVSEGDRVTAGQLLGKCGNSGNTTSPHVHMHVQDQMKPYSGRGRNITFHGIGVLLSGKQFDDVDWPMIQGLFVWQGTDE